MLTEFISSAMMLLGTTGIFLFLIKVQNTKLSSLDNKKLDKEIFAEHLKTFVDLKVEVKDIKTDIGDVKTSINKNNELLIRVDERLKQIVPNK